jgi:hypothetical protein
MEQTTEQVTSMKAALAILADKIQPSDGTGASSWSARCGRWALCAPG